MQDGVTDLASRYWDIQARQSPLKATSLGDYRYNDQIDNISSAAQQTYRDMYAALLVDVDTLLDEVEERDSLEVGMDSLDLKIMSLELKSLLDSFHYEEYLNCVNPLWGPQDVLYLPTYHPFTSYVDYTSYTVRLEAISHYIDTHVELLREAVDNGRAQPCVALTGVTEQLYDAGRGPATEHPLYSPYASSSSSSSGYILQEDDPLRRRGEEAISSYIIPAFQRLISYWESEYLKSCRDTVSRIDTSENPF